MLEDSEKERLERFVGPPRLWDESRDFQIEFLKSRGLQPSNSLLDLGCGVLRGGLPMVAYLDPGCYTGVDVQSDSLNEAYILVGKEGLSAKNPRLVVSRTFGMHELSGQKFDVIWCFQLLYHVPDSEIGALFQAVAEFCHERSVAYANINTVVPEAKWRGFPFLRRAPDFYAEIGGKHDLEVEVLGQLGALGYTKRAGGHTNHLLALRRRR